VSGNYYRPTRRNLYEFEDENEISNTRSEINDIQTESRDYKKKEEELCHLKDTIDGIREIKF
jgi:hypothetical protein